MTFLREIQLKRDLGSLRKNGLDTHKQTNKQNELNMQTSTSPQTNLSRQSIVTIIRSSSAVCAIVKRKTKHMHQ